MAEVVGRFALYHDGAVSVVLDRTSLKKRYFEDPKALESFLHDNAGEYSQCCPAEIPAPAVSTYHVVVSESCNLACTYCCYYPSSAPTQKKMSPETASHIADQFNHECPSGLLLITGGEPLTHWPVAKLIFERINSIKILYTNATLLTETIVQAIVELNIRPIVSLDGATKEANVQRVLHNGQPAYSNIIAGIRLLNEKRVPFGVSTTVTPTNVVTLAEQVSAIVDEFGPVSVGVNLPHYADHTEHLVRPEDYAHQLKLLFELSMEKDIFIDQVARRVEPLVEEQFRLRDCSAFGSKKVFLADGRVTNCQNIARYRDRALLRIDEWAYRIPACCASCANCEALPTCGGGCGFDGEMFEGAGRFDSRHCVIVKAFQEYFLWDIYRRTGMLEPTPEVLRKIYKHVYMRKTDLARPVGHADIDRSVSAS